MAQNYMFFLKVPLFLRGYFQKIDCFLKDTPSLLGWLISESPFAHHGFFDYNSLREGFHYFLLSILLFLSFDFCSHLFD